MEPSALSSGGFRSCPWGKTEVWRSLSGVQSQSPSVGDGVQGRSSRESWTSWHFDSQICLPFCTWTLWIWQKSVDRIATLTDTGEGCILLILLPSGHLSLRVDLVSIVWGGLRECRPKFILFWCCSGKRQLLQPAPNWNQLISSLFICRLQACSYKLLSLRFAIVRQTQPLTELLIIIDSGCCRGVNCGDVVHSQQVERLTRRRRVVEHWITSHYSGAAPVSRPLGAVDHAVVCSRSVHSLGVIIDTNSLMWTAEATLYGDDQADWTAHDERDATRVQRREGRERKGARGDQKTSARLSNNTHPSYFSTSRPPWQRRRWSGQ